MTLALLALSACLHSGRPMTTDPAPASPPDRAPVVELLTRPGCGHTDLLAERLQRTLSPLGIPHRVVQLGALPPDDPRRGFGSPTVLVDGAELFGLPTPEPPYAAPS